jgi:hypothetical protein
VADYVLTPRELAVAVRAARALPRELRAEFRTSVNREVAGPAAREVQAVAGRQSVPAARAFRNRGVAVKPSEEPILVVGGPESYGRTRMRSIAYGAEFGGGKRRSTYTRKGRKRGRSRSGPHQVTRRTTVGFGPPARAGRFVFPTLIKRAPEMSDAFLRIVARVTDEVWGRASG